MQKIYVLKKYVLASSAMEAIQKDKTTEVDDCWAEENVHKEFLSDQSKQTIGFQTSPEKPKINLDDFPSAKLSTKID